MVLNVKLIILSSYNYEHRDYDNVLSCGDMAPDSMEKKGAFKPKYYIILDHTGNHYKLITYKQKQIFEFNDIPVKIKKLIRGEKANVQLYVLCKQCLTRRVILGVPTVDKNEYEKAFMELFERSYVLEY